MAKAKTKKVAPKKAAPKKTTKVAAAPKQAKAKSYDPSESMIIQAGVIFIVVSAIAIFAYAFKVYGG
ncbi:MAG: hypothetical protein ACEQSA_05490 [Weeksellaceae bacterium]